MKLVQFAAVLALSTVALVPAANADSATLTDCIKMAKQASQALQGAQPGDATDAARSQVAAGRQYCSSSMYSRGVAAYSKALQLLGKA